MKNNSKFQELCQEYKLARAKYFDTRQECERFASYLITEMISYFQCPTETIKTFAIHNHATTSLREAINLESDGFWHLGIKFALYEEPYSDLAPSEVVLLHLIIEKNTNYFIVKLGTDGEEFKVNKNNSGTLGTFYQSVELKPFYEHVYARIKADFEQAPQRFEAEKLIRKIGF